MWKRLLVALLLLCSAIQVRAANYTDVYYDAAEPGWGVFLIQNGTNQFIAFFIYGPDGKPTWYTAQLNDDGTGRYTGTLYAIMGTYFVNPWQGYTINPAGTATFTPTDIYHATLTYTVNGLAPVSKPVVRQTTATEPMGGNYSGSMAGSITGCNNPADNDPAFRARYGLTVAQNGEASATLIFTFVDTTHNGIVCTVTGPLTHFGRLYKMGGTVACTGPGENGNPGPITLDSLHPTGQGIEGKLSFPNTGDGCVGSLHFAAVLNVNN